MQRPRIRPLFALLALSSCRFASQSPSAIEHWSITRVAANDVGWSHERFDPATRTTSTESKTIFNRLGNQLVIASESSIAEDAVGSLTSVRSKLAMAAEPTTTTATFEPGVVHVSSTTGAHTYNHDLRSDAPLVGPDWIRRTSLERLRAPGDEFAFSTFVAETANVAKESRTLLAAPAADGSRRVREEIVGVLVQTLTLDREGRVEASEFASPFGAMTAERSTRDRALAAEHAGDLPEETFTRTVVRSNVRLPEARELDSIVLRVTKHDGTDWPDLSSHDQTMRERADDHVLVEIRRCEPPTSSVALPVAITDANREFLEPNATIGSDDAEVQRIAKEVVGGERDAWRAACKLRDWVSSNMTFDLGIALAPASQVARERRGTCTSYAALLAALCRASGIPARYVMGFAYCDGAFGGHAWVEVELGDAWIPIDAALASSGSADAARIRFGASSLAEGVGALTAAGGKLYGNVELEVVEYSLRGRTTHVAHGAPRYRIDGDRYVNDGLGLELRKPAEFAFEALDAAWPERSLVRIAAKDGRALEVEERTSKGSESIERAEDRALAELADGGARSTVEIAGRKALRVESKELAALALSDGSEFWLFVARGDRSAELLDFVAATVAMNRESGAIATPAAASSDR